MHQHFESMVQEWRGQPGGGWFNARERHAAECMPSCMTEPECNWRGKVQNEQHILFAPCISTVCALSLDYALWYDPQPPSCRRPKQQTQPHKHPATTVQCIPPCSMVDQYINANNSLATHSDACREMRSLSNMRPATPATGQPCTHPQPKQ
jgi:hypothetical protein